MESGTPPRTETYLTINFDRRVHWSGALIKIEANLKLTHRINLDISLDPNESQPKAHT